MCACVANWHICSYKLIRNLNVAWENFPFNLANHFEESFRKFNLSSNCEWTKLYSVCIWISSYILFAIWWYKEKSKCALNKHSPTANTKNQPSWSVKLITDFQNIWIRFGKKEIGRSDEMSEIAEYYSRYGTRIKEILHCRLPYCTIEKHYNSEHCAIAYYEPIRFDCKVYNNTHTIYILNVSCKNKGEARNLQSRNFWCHFEAFHWYGPCTVVDIVSYSWHLK